MQRILTVESMNAWAAFYEVFNLLVVELDQLTPVERDPAREIVRRRLYVRSVFSLLEATTFTVKRAFAAAAPDVFSQLELLALNDRQPMLDDTGLYGDKRAKIPTDTNLKFVLNMFAKLGAAPEIDYGNELGWAALSAAIRIRDGVTHPRSAADLTITDAQFKSVEDGYSWFAAQVVRLGKATRTRIDALAKLPPSERPWRDHDESKDPEFLAAWERVKVHMANPRFTPPEIAVPTFAAVVVRSLQAAVFGHQYVTLRGRR